MALDGLGTATTTPFFVSHAFAHPMDRLHTQAGAVIAVFVVSNYVFAIIMWVLKRLIFETKVCARFCYFFPNTIMANAGVTTSGLLLHQHGVYNVELFRILYVLLYVYLFPSIPR